MARILHNGEWYEEISSQGHYERDFENILKREAVNLFSDYHLVPFKKIVYSEEESRRPDFALIHKSYISWWVVEVELAHHSFESHVLPQVRTLALARYGVSEADYLCDQDSNLNKSSVIEMLKGKQPRVLVIVNAPVEGWIDQLQSFGAILAICQVFRSRFDKYILRINGDSPSVDETVLTTCKCVPMLPRMLEIDSPASLPKKGEILLYHNEEATSWERTETMGQVYLFSLGEHNLKSGQTYRIVEYGNRKLVIETEEELHTL